MEKRGESTPSFVGRYTNKRGHEVESKGSAVSVLVTWCVSEVVGGKVVSVRVDCVISDALEPLLALPLLPPSAALCHEIFPSHCGWNLEMQNKRTKMDGAKTVLSVLAICEFSE